MGVGTGRIHNGCAQLVRLCAPMTHLVPVREDSWRREDGGGRRSAWPWAGVSAARVSVSWRVEQGGDIWIADLVSVVQIVLQGPSGDGGLVGPLGVRAVPGRDNGHMCPPGSMTSAGRHSKCVWFQSGKLVTRMFQKIQDLIDNKDALVFVLIDEVGVCGHRTWACRGSRLDRPLLLPGHDLPPAQSPVSHTLSLASHMLSGRRLPARSLRWRALSRGASLTLPARLSVPTGGEPHGRPQRLQGGHRAFRCHPRGQCRPDPDRSNQKVIVTLWAVGACPA